MKILFRLWEKVIKRTYILDPGKKRRGFAFLFIVMLLAVIIGSLVACKDAVQADSLNGTAYSRKMSGEIVNWNNTGCSYSLDKDGYAILSYDNGENTVKAPLILLPVTSNESPNVGNTGFFISKRKTAISYSSHKYLGPITIIISNDMGKTWKNTSIDFDGTVTWMNIGFTTANDGWLVVCSFAGMGAEKHYIYKTTDGGSTWKSVKSDIDNVYDRMLSGASFVNGKVGFLCFRYEYLDFEPAICATNDGGSTWSKLYIEIPEEFMEYNKTALSPLFDGTNIILPIQLSNNSGEVKSIYIKSDDCGKTWEGTTYTEIGS